MTCADAWYRGSPRSETATAASGTRITACRNTHFRRRSTARYARTPEPSCAVHALSRAMCSIVNPPGLVPREAYSLSVVAEAGAESAPEPMLAGRERISRGVSGTRRRLTATALYNPRPMPETRLEWAAVAVG